MKSSLHVSLQRPSSKLERKKRKSLQKPMVLLKRKKSKAMTTSTIWIIEPRDPFIARDGKPFGVGVSAATLPFPFPSTTTGGVRTRAGLASGSFIDSNGRPNVKLITEVKEIATCGALLVELDEDGEIA